MNRFGKITLGVGGVIVASLIIKKIIERDLVQDKLKERDALEFLRDKYGEEALEGKKIIIVDKEQPVTKTQVAKDFIDYEVNKDK